MRDETARMAATCSLYSTIGKHPSAYLLISKDWRAHDLSHVGSIHMRGMAQHSQLTLVPWECTITGALHNPSFRNFQALASFYVRTLCKIPEARVVWIRGSSHAFLLFGIVARLLGRKVVYDAPSFVVENSKALNPQADRSRLVLASGTAIEWLAFKLSDRVRVLSAQARAYAVEHYRVPPDKIVTIPVGTDIPSETWSYERCHKRMVSYIGSAAGWQGVGRLEGIAEILAQAGITIRFVGFHREPRTANVEYVGKVPYSEIAAHYLASHVTVIPRPSNLVTETVLPMKLITAMSYGVPIVASDVGGINEVVQDRREAYLVSPMDDLDLARGLIEVVDDPRLCRQLGRNARHLAERAFAWPDIGAEIDNLLGDLLQKGEQ